jgi:hypothetical protein
MTAHAIAWSIYGVFLVFLWFLAIGALVRYWLRREPPQFIRAHVERQLGVRLSISAYCKIVWFAAVFVTLGSLWVPQIWTSILEGQR